MAAVSTIIMAGAAVASAAAAVYSATRKPDTPTMPESPKPSNAKQYNDDGSITEQTYDEATNTYTTKTTKKDPVTLTDEEKADVAQKKIETAARTKLRGDLLARINKAVEEKGVELPTEERLKMYNDYATALSSQMHQDVDYRFGRQVNKNRENLEATGMTGSKAYADIVADEARTKALSDADIAQKAAIAKENLAAQDKQLAIQQAAQDNQFAINDRNTDINLLNNLDQGMSVDAVNAANQNRDRNSTIQNTVGATNAALVSNYLGGSSTVMRDYEARVAANASNTKMLTDTSKGLAYLYGYKSNTSSSPMTPVTTPANNGNPYQYMDGPGYYNMGVAT